METVAGWLFMVVLVVVNTAVYILIDGYFKNDIPGIGDDYEAW